MQHQQDPTPDESGIPTPHDSSIEPPSTATTSASPTPSAPPTSKLLLSPDEERILALYDRLQALRLEIALAKEYLAYDAPSRQDEPAAAAGGGEDDEKALRKAQEALLESRAKHVLQRNVVESVMMVAPIVKSVHSGSNTSPIEGDLYPLIEQRDDLSVAVAKKASELQTMLGELSHVRSETLVVTRRNVELAGEVLRLAEQARQRDATRRPPRGRGGGEEDEEEDGEEELRRMVKRSRQGWRTIKGVASAVVAASGVDWAGDPVLREIVLDPDEE